MKQQYDESFGIIPLRQNQGCWEVFLIQHRQHRRYWGFPKGHAEANETHEQSACRELKEETNLEVKHFIKSEPLVEQYQFTLNGQRVSKSVLYFIAEVVGDVILQKQEISDGIWLTFSKAMQQISHIEGKEILAQVEKILENAKNNC